MECARNVSLKCMDKKHGVRGLEDKMRKFKITYNSMTARYNLGYVYANSKEDAEREARNDPKNRSSFSEGERTLINATDVTNENSK